jgi:hypothetical protein
MVKIDVIGFISSHECNVSYCIFVVNSFITSKMDKKIKDSILHRKRFSILLSSPPLRGPSSFLKDGKEATILRKAVPLPPTPHSGVEEGLREIPNLTV